MTDTGMTPLPDNATVRGDPAPLSVIVRLLEKNPVVEGAKLTLMVQFFPAANDVPQLSVSEKGAFA